MKEIVLLNVKDEIEATFAEDVLKDNGIQSMRKLSGFSGYEKLYMGTTYQGIDIVIDEADFEKASTLLSEATKAYAEGDLVEDIFDESEESDGDFDAYYLEKKKKNDKIVNIIAGVILLGFAIFGALIIGPLVLTALSLL